MYVAATPSNEEKMFLWPNAFSEYTGTGKETQTVAA